MSQNCRLGAYAHTYACAVVRLMVTHTISLQPDGDAHVSVTSYGLYNCLVILGPGPRP